MKIAWSSTPTQPQPQSQLLQHFVTHKSNVQVFGSVHLSAIVNMPLGWERINVKKTPPNKNIAFIKTLPAVDEATSKDFLERIAAQCLPIMNNNHLAVVSLEEYEPNTEFLGTFASLP